MRPIIFPLTSFRFFAAFAVVIFHYDKKLQLFPAGFSDFGYEAVTFFFILSGFVLTYTHGHDYGLNVSNSKFARSRLVRIVPAYFLALIVAVPFFVAATIKVGHIDPVAALVPLMLQSWWPPAALLWNSPAWSLSNEIFFYALYPLIWNWCRRITPQTSLIISGALVLLVSGIIRAAIPNEAWHNFSAYFPLLNLPQFFLGIALAKIFLRHGPAEKSNRLLLLSVAATTIIIAFKTEHRWLVDSSVLCLVFATMVYALAGVTSLPLSALSARPLVTLGNASYSIYILHVPIWFWWDRVIRVSLGLQWTTALDFSAYVACVLVLSIAAMILVERPTRAWFRPPSPATSDRCRSRPARDPA